MKVADSMHKVITTAARTVEPMVHYAAAIRVNFGHYGPPFRSTRIRELIKGAVGAITPTVLHRGVLCQLDVECPAALASRLSREG